MAAAPGLPARQIPAHETLVLGDKRHSHVLVIPVINEGERIRRQLTAIRLAAPAVDLVIADGGSTDGSLDEAFLRAQGVRALLTKRDRGKLSAQLRVAYAWCLDQGYDGVLTMDGNGKDGVEGIGRIAEKLRQGYGYVQGSRYVPGGIALNTPPDRKFAGRFIHAPLLSLAARRWFTDTTNGFRGYSAQYLADPRVAPFRTAFDKYELLFYLTVRASQLGYKTCEVPVMREYPVAEKTPTKIAGFSGRWDMLRQLFTVVIGRYRPGRTGV